MIHIYWLKLTALHDCLAAQMSKMLIDETTRMANESLGSPNPKVNYLTQHNMKETCQPS